MLLTVLDGNGNSQVVIVQNQGAADDFSGSIVAGGVSQIVAEPNANRAGLLFQNVSGTNMTISELGAATDSQAFVIGPGAFWPPVGYPVPTTAINVAGDLNAPFVYREWSTLPSPD